MKQTISQVDLRKSIFGFATIIEKSGKGSVEDYARITILILAIKRILDLTEEAVEKEFKNSKTLLENGIIDIEDCLETINTKGYRFYEFKNKRNSNELSVMLLTWIDIIGYKENQNKEERIIYLRYDRTYKTTAKNFLEVIFEIIEAFSPQLYQVYKSCNYKHILSFGGAISYIELYKALHSSSIEVKAKKIIENENLEKIWSNLKLNEENVPVEEFTILYMELIGYYSKKMGKGSGDFFTPISLSSNIPKFLNLEKITNEIRIGKQTILNIGDPTSGSNSLLIGVKYNIDLFTKNNNFKIENEKIFFLGQEIKEFHAALGSLNMLLNQLGGQYNKNISFDNMVSDVITNYSQGIGTKRQRFDIVISNPNFDEKDYGAKSAHEEKNLDYRWQFGVPKKTDGAYAFLLTVIDMLNEKGQAVLIMPLGTLFKASSCNFRKKLLEKDWIEGLVILPEKMFITKIPVVIWILNKEKEEKDKGKVFMINASQDFEKNGKYNDWTPEKSVNTYRNREEKEFYGGYVKFKTLEKNKYNLSVPLYFSEERSKNIMSLSTIETEIANLEKEISIEKENLSQIIKNFIELENNNK